MSEAHSKYEVDDPPSNLSIGALSSTPLPPGSSCLERWEQPNHMLFQLAHTAVLLSFLAPNTTYGLLFLHSMLVVGRCRCHPTVRTLLGRQNAYKQMHADCRACMRTPHANLLHVFWLSVNAFKNYKRFKFPCRTCIMALT